MSLGSRHWYSVGLPTCKTDVQPALTHHTHTQRTPVYNLMAQLYYGQVDFGNLQHSKVSNDTRSPKTIYCSRADVELCTALVCTAGWIWGGWHRVELTLMATYMYTGCVAGEGQTHSLIPHHFRLITGNLSRSNLVRRGVNACVMME